MRPASPVHTDPDDPMQELRMISDHALLEAALATMEKLMVLFKTPWTATNDKRVEVLMIVLERVGDERDRRDREDAHLNPPYNPFQYLKLLHFKRDLLDLLTNWRAIEDKRNHSAN